MSEATLQSLPARKKAPATTAATRWRSMLCAAVYTVSVIVRSRSPPIMAKTSTGDAPVWRAMRP
jgi:hypothetical protein